MYTYVTRVPSAPRIATAALNQCTMNRLKVITATTGQPRAATPYRYFSAQKTPNEPWISMGPNAEKSDVRSTNKRESPNTLSAKQDLLLQNLDDIRTPLAQTRDLSLRFCSGDSAKFLEKQDLSRVTNINLSGTPFNVKAFLGIFEEAPHLRTFTYEIRHAPIHGFHPHTGQFYIRELYENIRIKASEFTSDAKSHADLENFTFQWSPFNAHDIVTILKSFPSLAFLDLSYSHRFKPGDIAKILSGPEIEAKSNLKVLNIRKSAVNAEDVNALINACPALAFLDLGGCLLTNETPLNLPPHNYIEQVNLSNTNVVPKTIDQMRQKFPNLRRITLKGCPAIDKEKLSALQAKHPELELIDR